MAIEQCIESFVWMAGPLFESKSYVSGDASMPHKWPLEAPLLSPTGPTGPVLQSCCAVVLNSENRRIYYVYISWTASDGSKIAYRKGRRATEPTQPTLSVWVTFESWVTSTFGSCFFSFLVSVRNRILVSIALIHCFCWLCAISYGTESNTAAKVWALIDSRVSSLDCQIENRIVSSWLSSRL